MIRLLDRSLDLLLVAVLAAMALIVAANVFCRFVLNFSIYWGDEAAQALLVWLTFLGAAVAVRERAHYAFDSLSRFAGERQRHALAVVSRGLTILSLVGLLYWGLQVTWQIRPWVMPAMGVSRAWVYAAGPAGCVFMLLYAVRDLIGVLRAPRAPTPERMREPSLLIADRSPVAVPGEAGSPLVGGNRGRGSGLSHRATAHSAEED
jgi:TRAP-type C4-dicarboxylate transport system permease small subunit